jgi:hypothetical protein
VTLPNSVTNIGSDAFNNCNALTNIVFGNGVSTIGDEAFYYCSSLANLTIGSSVTKIGNDAFYLCTGLTGITIPDSVSSIGTDAFYSCSNLTIVTVGKSVTNIQDNAFAYCTRLNSVYFKGNAPTVVGTNIFFSCRLYNPPFNYPYFYCLPGSTGWSLLMSQIPYTTTWNPQVPTTNNTFGVRTNRFGFTITGNIGIVVVVEACTNLANPVWQPLQTNTLTGGTFYFSDSKWTNYHSRFYGLSWP